MGPIKIIDKNDTWLQAFTEPYKMSKLDVGQTNTSLLQRIYAYPYVHPNF